MNVYINKPVTYSDMRGPCPEGFHIPSSTEAQGLIDIMTTLGVSSSDYSVKLHIPYSWTLNSGSGNHDSSGTGYWAFWCSNAYTNSNNYNYGYTFVDSNNSIMVSYTLTAQGTAIRPFKDSFVIPTASWTIIQGTLGRAGIFRNQIDGLISITSDGTTGYTIQDKNLGAITVYNDGDTLSEANCGKCYQRGNNYGFSYNGAGTVSQTKVDASNYGPGNYYSSSTFIGISGGGGYFVYDWSLVPNSNLRGGVSGLGGESELKNAYIGEVWTPGSNTIAYFPLAEDQLDKSGNGYTLTTTGTKQTIGYQFSGSNIQINGTSDVANMMSVWIKIVSFGSGIGDSATMIRIGGAMRYNWYHSISSSNKKFQIYNSSSSSQIYSSAQNTDTGNRYHLLFGVSGTTNGNYVGWINGNKVFSGTTNTNLGGGDWIIKIINNNTTLIASDLIVENRIRTDAEVLSYYNNTKSNYGL